ncbi:MAG: branched-chain amino acid transport system II carrier protein [Bacilli bacterium]|jgi:LIVCS family branched-chain amino acid:cation transporter|nr:branched-chain amino acid transport system II carrier protein [Bacilli bacterium]
MSENVKKAFNLKSFTIANGLMLFAFFFGAGNLMFPPYFGGIGGKLWFIGALGFIIGDVLLIVLGLYASTKYPKAEIIGVFYRNGRALERVLAWLFIIGGAWLVVLPRCGYLFHTFVTAQLFPSVSPWISSIVFFGICLILAINPNKVIDIVGKYLAPIKVVAILLLIGIGIAKGITNGDSMIPTGELFKNGLLSGYMTIDLMGATVTSVLIISVLKNNGVTSTKIQSGVIMKSAAICAVLLIIIYGGLTFLGSGFTSSLSTTGEDQAAYLVLVIKGVFGTAGSVMMAIIIAIAVCTTTTATIAGCGQLGNLAASNKISFKVLAIISAIVAGVIAAMGAAQLITFATMVVLAIYPAIVTNVILTIFTRFIRNDNVFRGASIAALVFGVLIALPQTYPDIFSFLNIFLKLPLVSVYLGWLIPAIICGIIGAFIKYKGYENRPFLRENAEQQD